MGVNLNLKAYGKSQDLTVFLVQIQRGFPLPFIFLQHEIQKIDQRAIRGAPS